MRRILFAGTFALLIVALLPHESRAQFRVGADLSWGRSDGVDPGLGIGLRALFGLGLDDGDTGGTTAVGALTGAASLTRFFPDCPVDCGIWEVAGGVVLPLFTANGITPYLGTGIRISRLSVDEDDSAAPGIVTDTDAGIDLLGGIRYRATRVTFFGDLRRTFGGGADPFVISFGVLLGG
jgi:hypothetical protein